MKKQILLFLLVFLPLLAHAFSGEVVINGVKYFVKKAANVAEVRGYTSECPSNLVIPASVEYEGVTCNVILITNGAFKNCTSLTSVTIPNSVTSIYDYTFQNCTSLTSITIPNSVTSIGYSAFENCTSLTSVTIPNSITSIGGSAFWGCTSLNAVYISDIAAWCNISFSDNPLSYAHSLFLNGEEVKDLVIPNSVTFIGDRVFYGCTSLTSVTIPNSVTNIGQYAFDGCSNLPSITIPNSVTSIGYSAFFCCTSLTSINIPNSVTSIGENTFSGCHSLASITIPNSVTSIGDGAFSYCTSLTSVSIPNSVTYIGWTAFKNCSSLTSIIIGSGIQNINERAFANCPDLTHVYCHAVNVPSTYSSAFNNSYPQYATLHVPDESIENYRNTSPWSQFGTIVGLSGGGGGGGSTEKCAKPTISYQSGKLVFNCATSGATCQYSITDTDITSGSGNQVQLTVTYNVSVYATKAGMENSDVATATLCWIDKVPTIHTDISQAIAFSASPVLIQSDGGTLTIQGADDGTSVSIYTSAGIQAGSAVSKNGVATVSTNLQPGSIAIIKIGNRAVKVVMK